MPEYKFNEGQIIKELKQYVDKTYESHYANGVKRQATEIIIDQGHGTGFCMGNILKYAQRYGKKQGHNKDDLMKVIHYAVIQLSQDHYNKSLDNIYKDFGMTSDTPPEKSTKFKSVILDDLLNKQENITYTFNYNKI